MCVCVTLAWHLRDTYRNYWCNMYVADVPVCTTKIYSWWCYAFNNVQLNWVINIWWIVCCFFFFFSRMCSWLCLRVEKLMRILLQWLGAYTCYGGVMLCNVTNHRYYTAVITHIYISNEEWYCDSWTRAPTRFSAVLLFIANRFSRTFDSFFFFYKHKKNYRTNLLKNIWVRTPNIVDVL